jgi:hypothetical protein
MVVVGNRIFYIVNHGDGGYVRKTLAASDASGGESEVLAVLDNSGDASEIHYDASRNALYWFAVGNYEAAKYSIDNQKLSRVRLLSESSLHLGADEEYLYWHVNSSLNPETCGIYRARKF